MWLHPEVRNNRFFNAISWVDSGLDWQTRLLPVSCGVDRLALWQALEIKSIA